MPSQLCALYAVTDVLLVTSLRDGMNLVSYEYVACQSKNAGVALFFPDLLKITRVNFMLLRLMLQRYLCSRWCASCAPVPVSSYTWFVYRLDTEVSCLSVCEGPSGLSWVSCCLFSAAACDPQRAGKLHAQTWCPVWPLWVTLGKDSICSCWTCRGRPMAYTRHFSSSNLF